MARVAQGEGGEPASRRVEAALRRFEPTLPLAVAYSGGADSTALLYACAARWPRDVTALHVHHGLQAAAEGFEAHCRATCAALGVPLRVARVDARAAPGQSPEDAARRARYAAFVALARADTGQRAIHSIALAHHADDQAETLLLALSRGAGLPGLAAMPAHFERGGMQFHRPFLGVPGAALRSWLTTRGIGWVEDPSNTDPRYTRNRIRSVALPALEAALPGFTALCARSARHAAEAQRVLDEIAAADLLALGEPPAIAALRALAPARQAVALRHWLRMRHGVVPSAAQLEELQRQLAACATRGHGIALRVGAASQVRRVGAVLDCYNPAPSAAP